MTDPVNLPPQDRPNERRAELESGTARPSVISRAALVVAALFGIAGVAGFIPGLTTNYDQMEFAGHESGAELLGLFDVSILHNVVHLLFAVAGVLLARTASGAPVPTCTAAARSTSCSPCTACWSTGTRTRTSCRWTAPTTGCTWRSVSR